MKLFKLRSGKVLSFRCEQLHGLSHGYLSGNFGTIKLLIMQCRVIFCDYRFDRFFCVYKLLDWILHCEYGLNSLYDLCVFYNRWCDCVCGLCCWLLWDFQLHCVSKRPIQCACGLN